MTERIALRGVSKRYTKFDDTPLLATQALRWRTRTRSAQLWALRDVDLSIDAGECVGVIGHNGSGKSTLLRLMAGVTGPTAGQVRVTGRVAPLISVGIGFHPELSGRENVYLNGIILGLSRDAVTAKFDEIVDFAEVPDFIDTPVKFYSTGMFMRLGFAVSVAADPAILLVDEVLAVGDVKFQLKCMTRMAEIQRSGAALVLVSHNLAAIRSACERVVVLHEGRVRFDGEATEGIALLHELLEDHLAEHNSTPMLHIEACDLVGPGGSVARSVLPSATVDLTVDARLAVAAPEVLVAILLYNQDGAYVYGESTALSTDGAQAGDAIHISAAFEPRLAAGTYSLRAVFASKDGNHVTWLTKRLEFFVEGRADVEGIADLGARITVAAQVTRSG